MRSPPVRENGVAVPADHNIRILDTVKFFPNSPGVQRYPLIVVCSCQWQSYAATPDIATQIARHHAGRNGTIYTPTPPPLPVAQPLVQPVVQPVVQHEGVAPSASKGVPKQT
jgi:hypothetical protein